MSRASTVFGVVATGVVTASRPACEMQTELLQYWIKEGIAQACKRAEKLRPSAGNPLQCVLCLADLTLPTVDPGQSGVVAMSLAMVLDGMTLCHDVAANFHMSGGLLADTEKRSANMVSG